MIIVLIFFGCTAGVHDIFLLASLHTMCRPVDMFTWHSGTHILFFLRFLRITHASTEFDFFLPPIALSLLIALSPLLKGPPSRQSKESNPFFHRAFFLPRIVDSTYLRIRVLKCQGHMNESKLDPMLKNNIADAGVFVCDASPLSHRLLPQHMAIHTHQAYS